MNERSTRFGIKEEPGQRMGHWEKLTDRTRNQKERTGRTKESVGQCRVSMAAKERNTCTVWMTRVKVGIGRNLQVRLQRWILISVS